MLNKRTVVLIQVIILYNLLGTSQCQLRTQEFGEKCDKEVKCKGKSWLRCIEETCQCFHPDQMIYENSTSRCVALAGENCKYGLEDGEFTRFETMSCVQHSLCDLRRSVCTCLPGYFESKDGRCRKKKEFNETCTTENDCSENLTCVGSKCACKPNYTFLFKSEFSSFCVGLAGQECVDNKCVPNGKCEYSIYTGSQGICSCYPGYFQSEDGLCIIQKHYNESCSESHECEHFKNSLVCVDEKCTCDDTSIWNPELKECITLPEKPCAGRRKCVKNANCNDVYFPAKCTCSLGYYHVGAICFPHYAMPCNVETNPCDEGKYSCIENRCDCKNSFMEIYDRKKNACIGLVGGKCSYREDCVISAFCSNESICECDKGFVENLSGGCDLAYGEKCDGQNAEFKFKCDTLGDLTCVNGKCDCRNEHEVFDEKKRACLRKEGSRCVNDEKVIQTAIGSYVSNGNCGNGLKCVQKHVKLPGRCMSKN